jgi:L(+)-tartrate dehydratase alpha subunit
LEKGEDAIKNEGLICSDTGWPLFYVRCGDNLKIEQGFSLFREVFEEVVAEETAKSHLRPTIVHPLTRKSPGTNVGLFYPKIDIVFDSKIDFLEIIFIPKGGGSEIFASFFKMLFAADGLEGVKKFILDSFIASCYSGGPCPPNIIGIGIGGTSDECMKIAKEAAILRPIGDRHPDPEIASLEIELLEKIKGLGYGAMGFLGKTGALDLHIECALVHSGGLPVAYVGQCIVARRNKVRITPAGEIVYSNGGGWIYR